jgi:hypothetical protein
MRYNSKCQSEAPLSSPSPREGRAGRGLGRGASFGAHPTASSVDHLSIPNHFQPFRTIPRIEIFFPPPPPISSLRIILCCDWPASVFGSEVALI